MIEWSAGGLERADIRPSRPHPRPCATGTHAWIIRFSYKVQPDGTKLAEFAVESPGVTQIQGMKKPRNYGVFMGIW